MAIAVVLALLCAVSYGASDFLGAVGARRLRVLPGTTITYAVACLVLLMVLPLVGGTWSIETIVWGAIAGVVAILGFLLFYAALAAGPMSLASPLIAVVGALVPVGIAVAIGERLELLAWVGVALAIVGGSLISVTRREGAPGIPRRTVVMSVFAGAGLGLSIVALDRAPADSGVTAAVVEIIVGFVLLGIVLLAVRLLPRAKRALAILDEEQSGPQPTIARARVASAAGGVLLGLSNALLVLALHAGSLAVVSVLVGLYPVVTIVLAAIVHRERMSVVQLAGVAAAIGASVLLAAA
ncbi:MAG: EamA family transporter [Salinibacterium sp.]|nr:EamA family transporter [Salinibacterium sp.]